jgi:3-deoxy-D-arabino-heptulosonate 7-phosphate (DAHP) synthase class II
MANIPSDDISENLDRITNHSRLEVFSQLGEQVIKSRLPELVLVADVVADLRLENSDPLRNPTSRCAFKSVFGEFDSSRLKDRQTDAITFGLAPSLQTHKGDPHG